MDCGCGGSTYGATASAEHPPQDGGYTWNGHPEEKPAPADTKKPTK